MEIFSIVVLYNGMQRNWIQKCFSSLQKSKFKTTIIAVDNASTDKSCDFIKENFPDVILIESKENLGFGKANNIGIEHALKNKAGFVFLLNQDAWVEKDTLSQLIFHAEKNPEYGIITCLHLTGDGESLDLSFSKSIAPNYCPNLYSDLILKKNACKLYDAGFVCAAAWLISKKCLREVGGFSPSFYHYAEDDNYIHRLHYKGLKIGVFPKTRIYHDREYRPKNLDFNSQFYQQKNLYKLNISNPNKSINTGDVLRHLRMVILKNFFAPSTEKYMVNKKLYSYLVKSRRELKENLEESKQGNFCFLDYKE